MNIYGSLMDIYDEKISVIKTFVFLKQDKTKQNSR